jgi:hypothetical protein
VFIFSIAKRVVSTIIIGAVAYYLVSAVQVVLASRAAGAVGAAPKRPIALVVATGPATPDPDMTARLDHATALRQAGRVSRIAVLADSPAQAVAARAYLSHHGTPAGAVSTYVAKEIPGQFQNYVNHNGPKEATVVCDSWDVFWLSHVAEAVGIHVAASPIPPVAAGIGNEAKTVSIEGAAVAWGRIAGFTQTGFIAG